MQHPCQKSKDLYITILVSTASQIFDNYNYSTREHLYLLPILRKYLFLNTTYKKSYSTTYKAIFFACKKYCLLMTISFSIERNITYEGFTARNFFCIYIAMPGIIMFESEFINYDKVTIPNHPLGMLFP